MDLSRKKFLVIGAGSIGTRHIKNLQSLGATNIFCLRRTVDKSFDEKNKTTTFTQWSEALNTSFDAAFICNPSSLHVDALISALKLKCGIFVEKPLTSDKHTLGLIDKELFKERPFMIGFMLRFHPFVERIREAINNKIIGDIYSARLEFGSYLPFWHPWEDYHISYAARKEMGGGVINTITHELDLMIFLFGFPDKVLAAKRNLGILGINTEELCEAMFSYNWGLATIHLDYLQKDYERRVVILGTEGKIIWKWRENTLIIEKHKSLPEILELKDFNVNQLYVDELKYFLDLIAKKQISHPLDINYAIENTNWMLKMHESSENEQIWVK